MICDTMPGKVCGECQFREKDTGKCHVMEWLHEEQQDLERLLYGHYGMRHMRGYKRSRARAFADSYCKVYHISMPEYHRRRVDALNEVAFNATEAGLLHSHTERGKTVL